MATWSGVAASTAADSAAAAALATANSTAAAAGVDLGLATAGKDALAAYAVKKLEVPAKAGTERVALDAWLHGRTPDLNKPAFAADSGGKVVSLNQLWKESK